MIARPEDELAGVVIELRLVDPHDFPPGCRINDVGITSGDLPFRDHALMVEGIGMRNREVGGAVHGLAQVSVELPEAWAARIREARVESEPEQAALIVIRVQR